jgi:chromosome segregation ATPase
MATISINRDDMYKTIINLDKLSVLELFNQRNNLITENRQLKQSLNIKTNDINYLFYQINGLYEQINGLLEQISILRHENENLTNQLNDKNNKIDELENKVDILVNENTNLKSVMTELVEDKKEREIEKETHKNIMITSESVILFDSIIVNYILGYENKNKYTLNDIVYETVKLDEKQINNYYTIEKELNINLEDMVWYLSRMKDERNYQCHNKYLDTKLSIDEIKNIMLKCVKDKDELEGYNVIINIIINKLKNVKGIYPFTFVSKAPKLRVV